MPPKITQRPPLPSASPKQKKSRRGRPRKKVEPEALLPFGRHEVTTAKKFKSLEKKYKTTVESPKKQRRNPSTSDRNYSADEIEFMNALDEYKRASGRVFPTCSEILGILRSIGYEKVNKEECSI